MYTQYSMAAVWLRGIVSLQLRQDSLYTPLPLFGEVTSAELIDKPCKVQQIRHAEQRSMLAEDDFRIGSNQVRPLLRNRADRYIISL